jgi:hypothetical protein
MDKLIPLIVRSSHIVFMYGNCALLIHIIIVIKNKLKIKTNLYKGV